MSTKAQTATKLSEKEESVSKAGPLSGGVHTITPYLAVREANELIDFVKAAPEPIGRELEVGVDCVSHLHSWAAAGGFCEFVLV